MVIVRISSALTAVLLACGSSIVLDGHSADYGTECHPKAKYLYIDNQGCPVKWEERDLPLKLVASDPKILFHLVWASDYINQSLGRNILSVTSGNYEVKVTLKNELTSPERIGQTFLRYYKNTGHIIEASIDIKAGRPQKETGNTVLHELGHLLGLVHVDECSIMKSSVDLSCPLLAPGQVEILRWVYSPVKEP